MGIILFMMAFFMTDPHKKILPFKKNRIKSNLRKVRIGRTASGGGNNILNRIINRRRRERELVKSSIIIFFNFSNYSEDGQLLFDPLVAFEAIKFFDVDFRAHFINLSPSSEFKVISSHLHLRQTSEKNFSRKSIVICLSLVFHSRSNLKLKQLKKFVVKHFYEKCGPRFDIHMVQLTQLDNLIYNRAQNYVLSSIRLNILKYHNRRSGDFSPFLQIYDLETGMIPIKISHRMVQSRAFLIVYVQRYSLKSELRDFSWTKFLNALNRFDIFLTAFQPR